MRSTTQKLREKLKNQGSQPVKVVKDKVVKAMRQSDGGGGSW